MSKMKNCKSCGGEVSKSAKSCPHCGAKLKMGFLMKSLIILVVLSILAVMGNNQPPKSVLIDGVAVDLKGQEGVRVIPIESKLTLGDVEIDIIDIRLGGLFRDRTGVWTAQAQQGATLLAMVINYKNVGDEPVNPFSLPDPKLVSPKGVEFDIDLGKTGSYAAIAQVDTKNLSDISPGLRSQKPFVFEVSEELIQQEGWRLRFGNFKEVVYQIN